MMRSNRKRSLVWTYYKKEGTSRVVCTLCSHGMKFFGNTSNLLSHLASKHKAAISQKMVETEYHWATSTKRRSFVWLYFKRIGATKSICRICSTTLMYFKNTSNLIQHLKRRHPEALNDKNKSTKSSSPNKNDNNETESNFDETNTLEGQNFLEIGKFEVEEETPELGLDIPVFEHNSVPETPKSSKVNEDFSYNWDHQLHSEKDKDLNESLVKFIVKNYFPFDMVTQPEFRNFVLKLDPSYNIPSISTLPNILSDMYEQTVVKIIELLAQVTACSLTLEHWTSVTNEKYISITVHFIDNSCEFHSILLDCLMWDEVVSTKNIQKDMEQVVSKWNIKNKIVAFIPDNSIYANITEYSDWNHIPCFVHILNCIVQNSLSGLQTVQTKFKYILDTFKFNCQTDAELQLQQKCTEFKLKFKLNDWNSTYMIFKLIIDIKENLMLSSQLESLLTSADLSIINRVCHLLTPFMEVVQEIHSEKYFISSKIILFVRGLQNFLSKFNIYSNDSDEIKYVHNELTNQIRTTFYDIENNSALCESTFMDPRFKHLGFETIHASERTKQSIFQQFENITNESASLSNSVQKSSTLWDDFDTQVKLNENMVYTGISEIEKYIQEPLLLRTANPFRWWKDRKNIYPKLYCLMKKKLCVVGNSGMGSVNNSDPLIKRRNELVCDDISKIVFLNCNL